MRDERVEQLSNRHLAIHGREPRPVAGLLEPSLQQIDGLALDRGLAAFPVIRARHCVTDPPDPTVGAAVDPPHPSCASRSHVSSCRWVRKAASAVTSTIRTLNPCAAAYALAARCSVRGSHMVVFT